MIAIDEHAAGTSPVHRWDPRYKLVGLLALAFAFASVRELWLLPAMVAVAAALVVLARLPWGFVAGRLRYPGTIILGLGLVLPLVSGTTVLLELGPLAVREEGALQFVLVAVRFACILTVALVLFGTATVLTSITAMRALGLPAILTDMALLAYRYIHELGNDLATMRRAARLRGLDGRFGVTTLTTLGHLVGSLFVRSYERSERIYQAMILRGYGQATRTDHGFVGRGRDRVALAGALGVAAAFVVPALW